LNFKIVIGPRVGKIQFCGRFVIVEHWVMILIGLDVLLVVCKFGSIGLTKATGRDHCGQEML